MLLLLTEDNHPKLCKFTTATFSGKTANVALLLYAKADILHLQVYLHNTHRDANGLDLNEGGPALICSYWGRFGIAFVGFGSGMVFYMLTQAGLGVGLDSGAYNSPCPIYL